LENDPVSGNNTSTNIPVPVLRNLKPVAVDDSISVNENIPISYNVMTNDIPSIKGGNVWKLATNPKHGIITFYPDGSFTYIPDMYFYGIDTFTYTLSNVSGDSSTAKVTINVMATPKVALSASKPVMNNDGTFRWRYTLTIINDTNLAIDSIQVTDNLDEMFNAKGCSFEVTGLIASGSLLSNGLFNGASVIDLLIGGKSMAIGVQDSIIFDLNVNTHGQQDTVSLLNQALFTANASVRKLSILSDADLTTRQLEPTQTNLPVVDLFIPEGFSPNNDSYNDKFVITHSLAVKIDFEVFNRWGNSVYKSSDYKNDWDGKGTGNFLGKDLPTGTYYCIYAVINSKTGETINKGEKYITLRR
jgi:gliding motility-associated-like protein